jgi:hypothetical protein
VLANKESLTPLTRWAGWDLTSHVRKINLISWLTGKAVTGEVFNICAEWWVRLAKPSSVVVHLVTTVDDALSPLAVKLGVSLALRTCSSPWIKICIRFSEVIR